MSVRQAQVVVYGLEGRVVERLEKLVHARRVTLHLVRQLEACRGLMEKAAGGVLILRLGRNLEAEMALLEEMGRLHPDRFVLVIGEAENAALALLAWDLGASYVLFPPSSIERLYEVVAQALPNVEATPP